MRNRIISLLLCALMLFSSVPLAMTDVQNSLSLTASALSTFELKEIFDSIPDKSQWDDLYVDSSVLEAWYDPAEDIINNPQNYNQSIIDSTAAGLKRALDTIEYKVTGISLDKTKLVLSVGDSATLKATLSPKNAEGKVTWTSSDSGVVSVDDGVVRAKKYSKTPVTITATSNSHSAKCTVTLANALAGVKLSESAKTIYDNGSFTLKATAVGKDSSSAVTDEVVYTWDSDNEKAATVSDTGKVKAVAKGTATITVTASVGKTKFSAKCTVKVNESILITGFKTLTLTNSGALSLVKGESESFRVQILPSTAKVKTLKWTSSNTKVVSITSSSLDGDIATGKFKAVGSGSAKITYAATDGSGKKGSFTVKVAPLVSSLSISESVKVVSPDTASVAQLKVTVLPKSAGNQVLNWSSSNESVCTVDRYGVLTSKARGAAVITAKTTDGSNIGVSCKIRVAPKSSGVTLNKSSVTLNGNGKTVALNATVRTVENTTYNGYVQWVSENPTVASVSSEGVVTANRPGTAKIQALTTDGKYRSAACIVTVKQPVLGVSLDKTKNVALGEKVTLKATIKPSYAENQNVTWSSSDKSVATVSSKGVVTAKKTGSCVITVKTADGGFTAKCTVSVVVPTTKIKLSKSSVSVQAGKTYSLSATVSPSNASNKTVKWSTSDKKVATVSSKGVITAVAGGKCVITAKASGGQSAKCSVSVSQGLSSITLSKTSLKLYTTQTYQLKTTLKPSTTTVKSFSWKSSNTSVATVGSNGVVTAKGVGSATITVSGGGKSAVCKVSVSKKVPVSGLSISKTVEVSKGRTVAIDFSVSPSNASNQTVLWSSSNTSVATVNSSGIVKGVKGGKAVITAKTQDGGYSKKCTVTVGAGVTGIRISDDTLKLSKGQAKTLTVTVLPLDADNRAVKWKSSNTSVATVSSKGTVTAVKNGTAVITATTVDGGLKATCTVKVYNVTTGIKLGASKLTMAVGATKVLGATVYPENASDKTVKWSSSDKSIVSVNSAGMLTAKRKGAAVITAKTKDGDHKATCTVTVVSYATGVEMGYSNVTINAGTSKMLTARVMPSTASNKKIKWSSSNKKVVTVNSEGKITAVAGGTATIKATSGDGKAFGTCKVSVLQKVSKITLANSKLKVGIGGVKIVKATVSPKTATNQALLWSSSDSKIATVDEDGIVKGIKKGTAKITAKSADGGAKAVCVVTVTKAATGVKLDKSVVTINVGQKTAVTATVLPTSASNRAVTWSTDNRDVATVSSSGVVVAVGPGYANITAKTKDGGYKAKCRVNVIAPVKSISLSAKSKTLDIGQKYSLKVVFNPKNASDDTVKWTSSNKSVASVSSSGVVTAKAKGTATITARSNDGGYTAKCVVTVVRKVKSVSLSKNYLVLYMGKEQSLKATVLPSDSSNKSLSWKSSNTQIVKVSSSGKLIPVKVGTATVSVTTADGAKTAKCTVKVEVAATKLALSKNSATLEAGKTLALKSTVSPSNATNKTVTWTSSNTAAATVSSKGVVTAVAGGSAVITAKTSNGLVSKCSVKVTQKISSLTLSKTKASLLVGESLTLLATVLPKTATDKSLRWSVSDESVLSVNSSGQITAIGPGICTVTVLNQSSALSAKCTVTVVQKVEGIALDVSSAEIAKGEQLTLNATVLPLDSSDKTVSWKSSNENVADVSATGKVTALGVGDAVITVTTNDGAFTASCSITVFEPVSGLDIDKEEITLYPDDTFKITAVVSPEDATNKTLIWSSSDSLVASVSSDGTVRAVKIGSCVVSVVTADGRFKRECVVNVVEKIYSITLDKTELVIENGQTKSLTASVEPNDLPKDSVKWKSSNESVATVDENGTITARSNGTAVVTASISDGLLAECRVLVVTPTSIVLSSGDRTMSVGESFVLTARAEPSEAAGLELNFINSDPSVATVENGKVTALRAGKTYIKITTPSGTLNALIVVTVK